MKTSVIVLMMCGLSSIANAGEPEFVFDAGLSLGSDGLIALPKDVESKVAITPAISLGVSQVWAQMEDWQFASRLSLNYAQQSSLTSTNSFEVASANAQSTGIWADTTVSYTGFSEAVRPFVTLGVGKVYSQFESDNQEMSDWSTGYKAITGFEFDLTEKSTLSFGVGHIDSGDLD